MGVSILSIIEVLYYVTLRLACNLSYRGDKSNKPRRNDAAMVDQAP